MDRIDIIIIFLMLFAIFRGATMGFIQLFLSTFGFIGGLLLGSYIATKITLAHSTALSRLLLVIAIELIFGLLFATIGEKLGVLISKKFHQLKIRKVDQVLGIIFELAAIIFLIWLISPAINKTQSYRLGYYSRHSIIISTIDKLLPPPPNILARLQNVISPNGFPNVFLGIEPQHTTVSPINSVNNLAITKDLGSVVKVYGIGCGGSIEGSGFVFEKGYVVTNAHVVAGIQSPEVIDQSGTYQAQPIWFDPNLDLAVLKVRNLKDSALNVSSKALINGDAAVILGYPNDGSLLVSKAVVIDEVTAQGQNIYNEGSVNRSIYELQSNVEPGNSGGPLIGPDGMVYGIVFAKSVSQNNVGYALLSNDFQNEVFQAEKYNRPVNDGQCTN